MPRSRECKSPGCTTTTEAEAGFCKVCKPLVLEAAAKNADDGYDPRVPLAAQPVVGSLDSPGCEVPRDTSTVGVALGIVGQLVASPPERREQEFLSLFLQGFSALLRFLADRR